MIDGFIARECPTNLKVAASRIGHESGTAVDLQEHDRTERFAAYVGDMIRTRATAALYQRMDNLLAHAADIAFRALVAVLVFFLAAHIGPIGFNDFAFATKLA